MVQKQDEVKFNEQAFLLDFFEEVVFHNVDEKTSQPFIYPNFIQLIDPSAGIINELLVSKNPNVLWKLTTAQMALLVPHIAIYKIVNGQQKRFYFDDYTKISDITRSTGRGRGEDVGLVSFTWDDTGTNPDNTGLSFEASMKLKFQSFDGLFKTRIGGIKFADLLVPPGITRKDQTEIEEKIGSTHRRVDERDFQIKVVVGWSTPEDPGNVVFTDPKIRSNINDTKISLLLTLYKHEINVNEDGSIDLTIDYMAAIEGYLSSPRTDLLKPFDPVVDEALSMAEARDHTLKSSAKKRLEKAKFLLQKYKGGVHNARPLDVPNDKELEKEIANLESTQKTFQGIIDKRVQQVKTEAHARLLKHIEAKQRIFWVELNPAQIRLWNDMNSIAYSPGMKPSDKRLKSIEDRSHAKGLIKAYGENTKELNKKRAAETAKHDILSDLNKELAKLPPEERQEAIDKFKTTAAAGPLMVSNNRIVNFFYFGDLIDAAIEVIKDINKPEFMGGSAAGTSVVKGKKSTNSLPIDLLLGTIDLYNPDDPGKVVTVPLSDVPISLRIFQAWFLKNVIEKNVERFPLANFLRRVCTELITGALSPNFFGSERPSQRTRLSTSAFLLQEGVIAEGKGYGRISATSINRNIYSGQAATLDITKQQQYYFLFIGGNLNQTLNGDRKKDEPRGIFHAFIGKQDGIVKRVSFKRTDIPGQKEARILDSKNAAQRNLLFSDFYNADITMFGNSIFKPGMLIFIDPQALGIGRPAKNSKLIANSQASQLGIGGYFRIIKVENSIEAAKFETTLNLIAETPLHSIQPVQLTIKKTGTDAIAQSKVPPITHTSLERSKEDKVAAAAKKKADANRTFVARKEF